MFGDRLTYKRVAQVCQHQLSFYFVCPTGKSDSQLLLNGREAGLQWAARLFTAQEIFITQWTDSSKKGEICEHTDLLSQSALQFGIDFI